MHVPSEPEILTTTVGSYSQIGWLANGGSEQSLIDGISVVVNTQKRAGIDLPTDGELYRFDPSHPETNGMIAGSSLLDFIRTWGRFSFSPQWA